MLAFAYVTSKEMLFFFDDVPALVNRKIKWIVYFARNSEKVVRNKKQFCRGTSEFADDRPRKTPNDSYWIGGEKILHRESGSKREQDIKSEGEASNGLWPTNKSKERGGTVLGKCNLC